jgi:hypothetical protein
MRDQRIGLAAQLPQLAELSVAIWKKRPPTAEWGC